MCDDEIKEEACIRCKPEALKHHAILLMETHADDTPPVLEIHVFVALDSEGQPQEFVYQLWNIRKRHAKNKWK